MGKRFAAKGGLTAKLFMLYTQTESKRVAMSAKVCFLVDRVTSLLVLL